MEAEIDTSEPHDSIVNKTKLDQDVMKPAANEANSSGSLNSDMSEHCDENDDEDADADCDGDDVADEDDDGYDDAMVDYDDDDDSYYMFENTKEDDEAHYLSMQAQFDNVDLPPGVEASFSWLNDPPPVHTTNSVVDPLADHHNHKIVNTPFCKTTDIASSSSSVLPYAILNPAVNNEDETKQVQKKSEHFKSFDIVGDFSDHHFNNAGFQGQQPPRSWTKKIQDEWKILEKDLPAETIFVRAYETRMDLLRAVIVGPAGTPYHDGLFVFDVHFPPTYPDTPPMVYYYSGGLRLNPNLYNDGKVCLSLLNTWTGQGNEKWLPTTSTMLQVLVSIQALILNDKPFYNEPGYEDMYHGSYGDKKSKSYNEDMFILSLKTMIYTIRRPPRHFEELVTSHFCKRAGVILSACRAYMDGAQVGSVVDGGSGSAEKGGSKGFKKAVARMIKGLIFNFSRCGATDCDQYRVES